MILVVVLIALLGISAFLSASETALFSLPSHWLKAARGSTDLKLKRIVRMMERPKDILVT
ncbi:MAG: Cyclin transrane N-terminal domain, partial [Chlamydiota bacterium]